MKKLSQSTSTFRRQPRPPAEGPLAFFDARNEAFFSALAAARAHFAVEGIHELRVEVKRLRALYSLIEYVTPSFAAKPNASSLRALYRAAGELRDIDIHQAVVLPWLRKLDLSEYFNHLKQRELRFRANFSEVSKSDSKSALSNSRAQIRSAIIATTPERMRKRMERRIRKLAARLATQLGRKNQCSDDLHAVRKASKALKYSLDVWQQCYNKTLAAEACSVRLKRTYGYLGEWRDYLLTSGSVESFLKHKAAKDLADPAAYEAFQANLRRRAESLLAAYNRGKKPLERALDRLSASLHQ
jgi:CHAD domain-containing protein